MGNFELLFDSDILNYNIEWKGRESDLLDAKVISEKGNTIGKIKTEGMSKVYLLNSEGNYLMTARRRLFALRTTYDIQNHDFLGIVEQKRWTRRRIMFFKVKNNTVLTLRGEEGTERGFPEGAYYFEDLNRMKVAEAIISTEKVKQSFWHTDRYNTCCLKIIAPTFDRQIIFGFFLAFLGNYYQSSTGGGV